MLINETNLPRTATLNNNSTTLCTLDQSVRSVSGGVI